MGMQTGKRSVLFALMEWARFMADPYLVDGSLIAWSSPRFPPIISDLSGFAIALPI